MSGSPAGGRQAPDAALVPIVGTAGQSKIPDPLQMFRNRELKVLGVALVLLGIIQCGMGIPPFLAIPLDFSQSGIPFFIAILFLVSGSLAIVSEKDPSKVLITACFALNVLGSVAGGVGLVIYLVDVNSIDPIKYHCLKNRLWAACFLDGVTYRMVFACISVLFLLTVSGMLLSVVLSIYCHQALHAWRLDSNMLERLVMSAPGDAEGSVLVSMEQGDIRMEESEQVPSSGDQDQRRSRPAGTGKRFLLVQKFLEGEPKTLGVILVVLGLSCMVCKVPLHLSLGTLSQRSGVAWWTGTLCIISGVLSIAAEGRPTVNMVRACLAMNIITSIVVSLGSLFYMFDSEKMVYCQPWNCHYRQWYFVMISTIVMLLLLLSLLAIVISIVLAVYARKALQTLTFGNMAVIIRSPPEVQQPVRDVQASVDPSHPADLVPAISSSA